MVPVLARVAVPLVALAIATAGCATRLAAPAAAPGASAPGEVQAYAPPPDPARLERRPLPASTERADVDVLSRGCGDARLWRCPRLFRLRPTESWSFREAYRTRPLDDPRAETLRCWCDRRARRRSRELMAGLPVFVIAYGLVFYEYGGGSFGVTDEGWFERDTKHGGLDKTGHFTAGTIWTAGLSALHRAWGFSRREAAVRGTISAFIALAAIEIADGTSKRQGFSGTDLIMDTAGCLVGYVHETSPWFNRVFDFRWEYWPTDRAIVNNDPTTDYEKSAHLLAINVGNLLSRRPSAWDLLDIQVGYRTRGYEAEPRNREQWAFVGVGLNVANLLRRLNFRYAGIFDYLQLPYVSLRVGYELNTGDTRFLWAP